MKAQLKAVNQQFLLGDEPIQILSGAIIIFGWFRNIGKIG